MKITVSEFKRKFRQLERSGERPTLLHLEVAGETVVRGEIRGDRRTLFAFPRGFRARFDELEPSGKGWDNPFKSSYGLTRSAECGFVA